MKETSHIIRIRLALALCLLPLVFLNIEISLFSQTFALLRDPSEHVILLETMSSLNSTTNSTGNNGIRNKGPDANATMASTDHKIPHRLIFTYYKNLLDTQNPKVLYNNVQHSIQVYRDFWQEPNATVEFLDDKACREKIQAVIPKLVPYFQQEERGDWKGDICRMAALYLTGGYYLDVDIEVIQPMNVPPHVSFVTAKSGTSDNSFFQAVLYSEPQSALMKASLDKTLQFYELCQREHQALANASDFKSLLLDFASHNDEESKLANKLIKRDKTFDIITSKRALQKLHERRANGVLGCFVLQEAYDEMSLQQQIGEQDTQSHPLQRESILLKELSIKNETENRFANLYPNLPRQVGRGWGCNFVVHDPIGEQPYFWSRVVGTPRCSPVQVNNPPPPPVFLRRPISRIKRG